MPRLKFGANTSPACSGICAVGAFGAGFLTRPLGALLFGWIGDHHGRERALTLSIFAMALPTFLTGTLPDYATIGVDVTVRPRRPEAAGDLREAVRAAVTGFLHPVYGGPAGEGFPFGARVSVVPL